MPEPTDLLADFLELLVVTVRQLKACSEAKRPWMMSSRAVAMAAD